MTALATRPDVLTPAVATTAGTPAPRSRVDSARRFGTLVGVEARVLTRDMSAVFFGLIFPAMLLVTLTLINAGMADPLDLVDPETGAVAAGMEHLVGVSGVQLYLPALLALAIATPALQTFPITFATFREKGVLRRLSATPMRPQSLLGAHVVITVVSTVAAAALAIVLGHALFGLRAPNQLGVVLLTYALGMVTMLSVGMILAAVVRRVNVATGVSSVVYFVSIISAGVMGMGTMDGVMATVARISPLGSVSQALTIGWFENGFPLIQVVIMAAWTAVLVPLAVKLFRWS
jgi:ABC-2 type transport system permease protein